MLENTPWLVSGAEHSAALARTVAYASTGGKEGVASPGDLKVVAQNVPDGSVRVLPGVATLLNSYPGGSGQAYTARNLSETDVTINPTGSGSGRSDLIVLSITDPEYGGEAPTDPNTFEYTRIEVISGVSSDQRDLSGLNFPRPAIPLALVTLPPSTGTVQSGHIKDLRFLANPRTERHLFVYAITQDDGIIPLRNATDPLVPNPTEVGDWWPNPKNVSDWTIDVPEWAQRVRMVGQWGGVLLPSGGGNAWGRIWARIGSIYDDDGIDTQEVSWDLDSERTGNSREAWMTGADRAVPTSLRGTKNQWVGLRGRVISKESDASLPTLNSLSVVTLDVEFYETVV